MAIFKQIKDLLKDYFRLSDDLDDLDLARQTIVEGVSFKGANIIILIIAIFIASLGLNTNSAAVIIGAMLISPLMGPIIGIGLGVGTYDFDLIKRASRNLVVAALFSVLTATIFFLISPVSEGRSELLARTSPTIYDVLIGFFGGAAGIVAIACKQKGNVIPGVAIATALMPPLCTAGYGLATWQLQYFFGATYLFLINSIFIAFATLVGVKLFKFKEIAFIDQERRRRIKRTVMCIVVATMLPSIYLTFTMLRESFFVNDANAFIEQEFQFPNTQVFSKDIYTKHWQKYIRVTLIGQRLNTDSLHSAILAKMDRTTMLRGTNLTIVQGFGLDNTAPTHSGSMGDVFNSLMGQMDRQRAQIDSLDRVVAQVNALDSLSYTIAPEVKVLYPEITYLALNRTVFCDIENRITDTVNIALIENAAKIKNLDRIRQYLEVRTGLKDIHIIEPGKIFSQPAQAPQNLN